MLVEKLIERLQESAADAKGTPAERCEVRPDPHDPKYVCRAKAVAEASQAHHRPYRACEEHAREAARDGLDVEWDDGDPAKGDE